MTVCLGYTLVCPDMVTLFSDLAGCVFPDYSDNVMLLSGRCRTFHVRVGVRHSIEGDPGG